MGVGLPATVDAPAQDGVASEPRSQVTLLRPRDAAPAHSEQDADRLTELLRSHYASVWRTLRQLGVGEAHVDDATQEVFIVLSRRLTEVREGSERTFLLSSAVRVAANYRRSWHVRHEVADEQALATERDPRPTVEQMLDQKRLRQAFDDLLQRWPDEIRTAFVLFELEGLTAPEIAQITETKLGTVTSRLRRGRELFQAGAQRLRARGAGDDQ
jgi:RNA polymerase sigma-70 factor (ECF subfamily)